MKNSLVILMITVVTSCYCQVDTFCIAPNQTDPNYEALQNDHFIVRNTSTHINKLLLFLGGTNSNPKTYHAICNFSGELGYDVISLSYENTVAAASFANHSDSLAFNKYRQEICYGTPESPDVNVDILNSIYTRTINLLNYLHLSYPNQNWNQYLIDPTSLDWSKIIVAGHSQGSGHACYFGKLNLVDRVLMFSGPNDYSNFFSNAAPWLETEGVTPIERHFSYLSLLDEVVDFEKQLTNIQSLNLYPTYDTTYVDNSFIPYNNSHCLYTTQSPGFAILNHNTPIKSSTINESVWEYMLNSIIVSDVETIGKNNILQFFPNPTNANVNIISKGGFSNKTFSLYNIRGQLIMKEKITTLNSISIDLSAFPKGLYFINIDNQLSKIIKY